MLRALSCFIYLFFIYLCKNTKLYTDVMNGRGELGRRGEEMALEYLEGLGMRLLARNWRWSHKELDLVMESDDAVHVVEVKTLRSPSPIEPWEQVDRVKRANMVAAASRFISQKHLRKEVQFDIVSIKIYGERADLRYIPRAFYPIKID